MIIRVNKKKSCIKTWLYKYVLHYTLLDISERFKILVACSMTQAFNFTFEVLMENNKNFKLNYKLLYSVSQYT